MLYASVRKKAQISSYKFTKIKDNEGFTLNMSMAQNPLTTTHLKWRNVLILIDLPVI